MAHLRQSKKWFWGKETRHPEKLGKKAEIYKQQGILHESASCDFCAFNPVLILIKKWTLRELGVDRKENSKAFPVGQNGFILKEW